MSSEAGSTTPTDTDSGPELEGVLLWVFVACAILLLIIIVSLVVLWRFRHRRRRRIPESQPSASVPLNTLAAPKRDSISSDNNGSDRSDVVFPLRPSESMLCRHYERVSCDYGPPVYIVQEITPQSPTNVYYKVWRWSWESIRVDAFRAFNSQAEAFLMALDFDDGAALAFSSLTGQNEEEFVTVVQSGTQGKTAFGWANDNGRFGLCGLELSSVMSLSAILRWSHCIGGETEHVVVICDSVLGSGHRSFPGRWTLFQKMPPRRRLYERRFNTNRYTANIYSC